MCLLLLFGCCSVMSAKPMFDTLINGKSLAEAPPITTANLLIDVAPSSTTPGTGTFSYKIRYRLASVTDNGSNANIAFTLPSSLEIVSLPVVGGNVKATWTNNNQIYVSLESPASMGLPAGTLGAGSAGILEAQVRFKCGVNGAGGMPAAGTTVNLVQNPVFTVSSVSATAAAPSAVTVPTLAACLPPASTTPTGIHKGKSGTVTGRGEYMHWWIEHGATTSTPYYVQDMLPNDMYLFDGLYCCSNFLPGYTVEVYANNTWWNITNYGKISTWIQSVANGGQLKDQNNVNITGCTRVQVTMPNDFTYGGSISYASNVRGVRVTVPANSSASGFALYTYTLPSAAIGWRQNCITSNNPSWANFCTDVFVTDKPGLGINCAMGNYNGNTQLGGTALFQGEWGGYNYLINNYPNLYKDPLDIQGMTSIYHYTKAGGLTGIKVEVILPAGFDFIQTGAQPNYYVVEASSYLSSYNSASALIPTLTKNSNWVGTGRVALTWDFPNLNFPANGPVFINNPLMTLNVFFSARYVGTAPLPNAGDFLIYQANVKANVPFIDQYNASLVQETWCSAYSYTIPTSGGSVNSSKFVKGAFDTEQSRYPIVGSTNLNGDGEYEMYIYNHGFQNLKQLDIADVLPHIGDLDMLSATARGSQWSMELVEGISVERFKIGTGLVSATSQLPLGVLYSTSTTPCYLEGALPSGYVNADPSVANHGVGSGATVPSGCTDFNGSTPAAGARAFTFRWLNSIDPLKFGEYLKIKVKVKQLNGEADRTNQEVAWNSFAYSAIESDNDRLLSTEPIKVGLRMVNPNSTASIGDFVWKDLNGNGRQDAGEPGISGVKVYLYDGGGNKVTESFTLNGNWVSVPIYKVTDSTGKYNFMGLYPGSTYYVRLEDTANFAQGGALGGLVLTTANAAGVADDIDSDAANGTLSGSPALARPQITATTGAAGTTTNTYDFGFVAPGTIGNYVWFDADADGEQDPTETGVSGVTMTLYNAAGTVIATQTTNSQGFYLFSNIFPGNYYVQASTLPANRVATAQNATGNNETDSDFGSDLKTTLFTLSSGENIGYIDLGLRTPPASPASICGMAWDDFNQDGTRQAGEGGIRNVTVQLLSSTGFVITSTLTDASGNYCFMNLTPGTTYRVGFVNPAPGVTSFTVTGTNQQANPTTGITTLSYTPTAGQNITNVDGGFIGPFSIGNLVFRDNNRNALFDAGDNAYQGIKVYLLNSAGTTILDSTVTDENGRYLFPLLAVGTYMVEIVVPNNFYSSTDIASSATPNNVDNDDNGVGTAPNGTRRIRTNAITLQAGGGTSGSANWTETDHGVLIDGYLDPAVNPKAYYTVDLGLATCPNITTQPLSNAYLCVGSTQSLSVVVEGAAFTYQWQSSTNGTSWTNISGATNASYTVPTTSLGTTYYRVMITSSTGCNTIYSNVSTIEVQTVAINLGADITQCYNAMFVMNAPTLASGQWGVWSVISGTANISDVYDRNAAITVNNGQTATLRWTVSNGACSAFDDIVLTNSTSCTAPTCPADAINFNGDLEQEGTATNFNLTFQGTSARLIDANNRPAGWKDLYGSTPTNTTSFLGAFYMKKTGAAGNPHSGTHMVYLKGNGFCLGALETGSNLQCGKTYRFTVWAAAYTTGATQLPAPFAIEYSVGNSGIYSSVEGRHVLLAPASTSWNNLNWQRYSVEFTLPTDGFSWANFYFTSYDDNLGILFDDICVTEVNNGTYAYAGQDQGGCNNAFTMAATPVTAGYTGTWSVVSGSATIANPTSATTNVTITSGNAATLRWTVTSGTSCTSTDDVTIGFVTPPSVTVNNATICNGNSATLTASGCSGGNLTWSTGATSSSITISPASTTSYSVTCSPSPSSNLLLNPSFESNLTSWGIWGGSVTATTNVADVQSGTKAARINGVSAGWAGFGQSITVTPGQFYTLTFYGKVNVAGIYSDLEVKFFDASYNGISSHIIPIKSTTYQLYTQTFVVPANTANVQIGFGTDGITWLDNFSLIRSVNACNNSATGTVTVTPSVSISTPPANMTQCVGGTQSLSVTASNATTYQWQSSPNNATWTNISGQTSATYIPPSTTAGTTYYRVLVGNATCTAINSNSATVVIVADPSVTVSGGGSTICRGGTATLTANVSNGAGTTTYQWQSSNDNSTFANISGATNATYTTPALSTTTFYRVIINQTGSGCGSATSASVTVNVVNDPSVNITTNYTTLCSGGTVTLSANVSEGNGTTTYQWQNSTDNITFSNISGVFATYTTPALTATSYYRVNISQTGVGCNTISATTTITVNADPTVTVTGGNTVCQNGSVTLTSNYTGGSTNVTNVGTCVPTASWTTTHPEVEFCTYNLDLTYGQTFNIRDYLHIKDGNLIDTVNWKDVYFTYTAAGANDPTNPIDWRLADFNAGIPVTVTSADDATGLGNHNQGEYRIYVVRRGMTTFDDHMTIRVNPSSSDINDAKCDGWAMICLYRDRYGSSGGTPLANVNVTITFSDGSARTVQTNNFGQAFAQGRPGVATIAVNSSNIPAGLIPQSGTYTGTINILPSKIIPFAAAYNPNLRTYQWQSSANGSTWTNVSGATAATYSPPTASAGTTYYRLVLSDAGLDCATATSAMATVTVNPSVSISAHPANITQCVGGTQSLSVTASNATTYQWQSSPDNSTWANISGQMSATYTPPSTTAGTTYYRVVVSSASCGSANSNSATVVINSCIGSVGNYVWTDINGDGINNEAASAGMNGVTVQLYTAANVLVATTTTANDGSGNPGYYNFVITTSGDYYVKFPTTFGSKIVSPFQTTTAGIDNNSDANPSTGNSPTFTINVMGSGVTKDNPTIDAAFKCNLTASVTSSNVINCTNAMTTLTATPANGVTYAWNNSATTQTQTVSAGGTYTVTVTDVANGCVASANVTVTVTPMATVGNYVWTDTNGNGLNDEAATAGINNITVELWNSTTNTLVATTTTASNGGNPGYYQFCVTTSGSYYVKFPIVNGIGRGLTTQTTTAATDNNSDANATTGQSPVFSLDVNGTGTAKNNITIDAGYKVACPTGNCVPITIVKTN